MNTDMAPVLTAHVDQALTSDPCYVKPMFIHDSVEEVHFPPPATPNSKKGKTKPYCPGAMLSESVSVMSGCSQHFGNAAFGNDMVCAAAPGSDPGTESDCSTTDTMNESMQMAAAEAAAFGSQMLMMPNMGMLPDSTWSAYPAPNYWVPYQTEPTAMWLQMPWASTGATEQVSNGSAGHHLGRCKPCAFMFKDGCLSGADCPYCHLCPPGEKQRRKRVMRGMQRTIGSSP